MTIYTIGHSTRSLDEFLALLRAHAIDRLADVRTVPKSRRHPHFAREALSRSLPEAGIEYRHFAGLGGLRKPRPDSRNTAWRHGGFRGYADYMETPEFEQPLEDLIAWAARSRSPEGFALQPAQMEREGFSRAAIMCAEAVWWRCHRQLIADALVVRGAEVRHITSAAAAAPHKLTEFARQDGNRVVYR